VAPASWAGARRLSGQSAYDTFLKEGNAELPREAIEAQFGKDETTRLRINCTLSITGGTMINAWRINGNSRYILNICGMVLCLAGCAQDNGADTQNEPDTQNEQMAQPKMTLWQAIDALPRQIPFTKIRIERLLSAELVETDEGGNDLLRFFKSNRVKLLDGVVIENVDLRIKRVGPDPGFLVLDTGGSCVTIEDVRLHYKNLRITDRPRGRSLEEVTSHTTTLSWGTLSFGFKERNRKCLASVAFDPTSAKTGDGSGE